MRVYIADDVYSLTLPRVWRVIATGLFDYLSVPSTLVHEWWCQEYGMFQATNTSKVIYMYTVEPPITDPLRSGQPLYSGQTLCYRLNFYSTNT